MRSGRYVLKMGAGNWKKARTTVRPRGHRNRAEEDETRCPPSLALSRDSVWVCILPQAQDEHFESFIKEPSKWRPLSGTGWLPWYLERQCPQGSQARA
jgi:hypothetical protein